MGQGALSKPAVQWWHQGGGPNIFASSLRWFRASRLAGVCRLPVVWKKIEIFSGIAPARLVLF